MATIINIDDDNERVRNFEELNNDIREYNKWVDEKNEIHSKELLQKAPK